LLRLVLLLSCVSLLLRAAFASAGAVGVTSGALQGGSDVTLSCDPDGVTVSFENTDSNILNGWEQATVGSSATLACVGEEVLVEVLDGSGGVLAYGTGTYSLTNTFITLADPLAPEEVPAAVSVRVTIVS
jgi:hypothetical protein